MRTVAGQHKWTIGSPIGGGGFGQVFQGFREGDPRPAAIKFVIAAPGAERELLLQSIPARNVVPVIDSGVYRDERSYYFLVMPLADFSLADVMLSRPDRVALARQVAVNVASALVDLEPECVHRDIKPANILFYRNSWCLSDFGVSRYAAASTDPQTRKHSFTPLYAAPEQWRGDHATQATDIYLLGTTLFHCATGSPPFDGDLDELRKGHCFRPCPQPRTVDLPLNRLIERMTLKNPNARPSPQEILDRLVEPRGGSVASIEPALEQLRIERVNRDVERELAGDLNLKFREWVIDARVTFRQMLSDVHQLLLETQITDALDLTADSLKAAVGSVALSISGVEEVDPRSWNPAGSPPQRAVAYATIHMSTPRSRRSTGLWYCEAESGVGWYSIEFDGGSNLSSERPFGLPPGRRASDAIEYPSPHLSVHAPLSYVDNSTWPAGLVEGFILAATVERNS